MPWQDIIKRDKRHDKEKRTSVTKREKGGRNSTVIFNIVPAQ